MKRLTNHSGFTLLEIIVVLLIIAVLAGLALPRFFRTVEYSKGVEALTNLGTIRQAMQRCYLFSNNYTNCVLDGAGANQLDIDDPNATANAMFTYVVNNVAQDFTITATQKTDNANTIILNDDGTKVGTGVFASLH